MPAPSSLINLFSDTQTRPTAAMREAMAAADVGDDQLQADPTVNALCARVADLLGMEAALFLPTGTMCNQIAFLLHASGPGDAAVLHRLAHPLAFEGAGMTAIAGTLPLPVDGPGGTFEPEALAAVLPPSGPAHSPRARLVCVEQTTNVAGGRVWPLEQIRSVLSLAREHGLAAHLDGARLLNAVVATGVPAADWASGFDTAWIDGSKGLGGPLGAVMAGTADTIAEARRLRHMLGGAMRQAGIAAAGMLHALDHHVDRLAEDHANARDLAAGLAALTGVGLDEATVETNIVVFEVPDAAAFVAAMRDEGVALTPLGPTTVRAVTHLDVGAADIALALSAAERVLAA